MTSKKTGVKTTKILEFSTTPIFGKWKKFFPEEATEHTARMNLNLLNYLILKYTKEEDLILDPMAGSGSTGILASLNNRNSILIELEKKICRWIKDAKRKVEQQQTFTKKGKITIIQGDARNIPKLVKKSISAVITSPPYYDLLQDTLKEVLRSKSIRDFKRNFNHIPIKCSTNPINIGNITALGSYLGAVKKVYTGCFQVLKPDGRMIITFRNSIRNKKLLPLTDYTILLCRDIGFSLEDHLFFKLPFPTIWRNFEKNRWEKEGRKYPEDMSYEHILVFKKEI